MSGWGDAGDDIDQNRDRCKDRLSLLMRCLSDQMASDAASSTGHKWDDRSGLLSQQKESIESVNRLSAKDVSDNKIHATTDLYKRREKQGQDCLPVFDTAGRRKGDKWATGMTDWGDGGDGVAAAADGVVAVVVAGAGAAAAGGIRRK